MRYSICNKQKMINEWFLLIFMMHALVLLEMVIFPAVRFISACRSLQPRGTLILLPAPHRDATEFGEILLE